MGDRKWQDAPSTPAEIQQKSTPETTENIVVVKPTGSEPAAEPTKRDDGKRESLNIKIHLNLRAKVKLELDAQLDGDIIIGFLSCFLPSSVHSSSLKMEGECKCEGVNKDFPAGSVLRKYEKAVFPVADRLYRLKKILFEHYNTDHHQRRAMFEAEDCETKDPVAVKFFVEADPFMEKEGEKQSMKDYATNLFLRECNIWRILSDSGYTPKYYGMREMHQDRTFENPGGYLLILVLGQYPTLSLEDAPRFLSDQDLPAIEAQMRDMAIKFNKHGLDYFGLSSFFKYDPRARRVYATDVECFDETEVYDDPLAEEHPAAYWISVVMKDLRAAVKEISERRAEMAEFEFCEYFDRECHLMLSYYLADYVVQHHLQHDSDAQPLLSSCKTEKEVIYSRGVCVLQSRLLYPLAYLAFFLETYAAARDASTEDWKPHHLHRSLEEQQSILQRPPVRHMMNPDFPPSSTGSWVNILLTTSTLERILDFFIAAADDQSAGAQHARNAQSHAHMHTHHAHTKGVSSTWTKRREFLLQMRKDWDEYLASVGGDQTATDHEALVAPPGLRQVWFEAAEKEMYRRGVITHRSEDPVHILHGSCIRLHCEFCDDQY
ncbi:uncharacterized protein CDV56_101310 [Aspergillus thermomutatus]|uniref:Uncharacterized protein n=1 Tax=Aspergillus thermomutatus TaxID=41047 RepID=A0A397G4F3_ASPTH|nr:uncharacterized protein CDV56_101310 [Aspergillus thermomutatus]RHZ43743.1 hypothetical protein CDV56_101310 [Aspergillus thermomutatus]